jgi:glutaredoxin
MSVVVYGKEQCPNCVVAKNILKSKNIEFEYVDVTTDESALEYVKSEWVKLKRQPSVPAITINGEFVGGVSELNKYLSEK